MSASEKNGGARSIVLTVAIVAGAILVASAAFNTVFGFVDKAWNGSFMDWLAPQFLNINNLNEFGIWPEMVLDVSGIRPAVWKVEQVTAPAASANAALADLRIGGLTLSPAFSAGTLTGYTASTTNATNTVTAIPADANATIEITNEGTSEEETTVVNGRAVTWATGANTLTVKVTAEDGTTTKSYVVTVTKS